MRLGPFGLAKSYSVKELLAQSMLWMSHTRDESHFFDIWKSEYTRVKGYNKERGRIQREKLGKAGMTAVNRAAYIKNRERNVMHARAYRVAVKNDPIKSAAQNAYRRKVRTERFAKDPEFKLKFGIRTRIGTALKRYNGKKKTGTTEYIGCTVDEYRKHIESLWLPGMSWANHGLKGWHIDHKIPCAKFDFSNQEEIRKCFHYSNTQPMWAADNLSKGDRLS